MSQSDYIKYKRVANQLNVDNNNKNNKLAPVLSSQNYIDYSQYTTMNGIINNTPLFDVVPIPGTTNIFGMTKYVTNCPSGNFITCRNTNTRPNRLALSSVYFTPKPQPRTIEDTKHAANKKSGCSCVLDSINTERNICKCKKGAWGTVR